MGRCHRTSLLEVHQRHQQSSWETPASRELACHGFLLFSGWGAGKVICRSSPAFLPLFPKDHVDNTREWSPYCLFLGPHGHDIQGVTALLALFPVVSILLWLKHLLFLYTFAINTAVIMCALLHCFVFLVNCYLNPWSLLFVPPLPEGVKEG